MLFPRQLQLARDCGTTPFKQLRPPQPRPPSAPIIVADIAPIVSVSHPPSCSHCLRPSCWCRKTPVLSCQLQAPPSTSQRFTASKLKIRKLSRRPLHDDIHNNPHSHPISSPSTLSTGTLTVNPISDPFQPRDNRPSCIVPIPCASRAPRLPHKYRILRHPRPPPSRVVSLARAASVSHLSSPTSLHYCNEYT